MIESAEQKTIDIACMVDGLACIGADREAVMDELLEAGPWQPFSRRFGAVAYLEGAAAAGKFAEESTRAKICAEGGVFAEKIDFNDESFSSLRRMSEDSNECNYECEETFKEAPGRYVLGKNFQCPVKTCKKVYTSSYGLRYHMDHGHTAEKTSEKRPYVCNIGSCGKSYKNNNGLKYHITHAHKGVAYNEADYMF